MIQVGIGWKRLSCRWHVGPGLLGPKQGEWGQRAGKIQTQILAKSCRIPPPSHKLTAKGQFNMVFTAAPKRVPPFWECRIERHAKIWGPNDRTVPAGCSSRRSGGPRSCARHMRPKKTPPPMGPIGSLVWSPVPFLTPF